MLMNQLIAAALVAGTVELPTKLLDCEYMGHLSCGELVSSDPLVNECPSGINGDFELVFFSFDSAEIPTRIDITHDPMMPQAEQVLVNIPDHASGFPDPLFSVEPANQLYPATFDRDRTYVLTEALPGRPIFAFEFCDTAPERVLHQDSFEAPLQLVDVDVSEIKPLSISVMQDGEDVLIDVETQDFDTDDPNRPVVRVYRRQASEGEEGYVPVGTELDRSVPPGEYCYTARYQNALGELGPLSDAPPACITVI